MCKPCRNGKEGRIQVYVVRCYCHFCWQCMCSVWERGEIEELVAIILWARPVCWVSLRPCTAYSAGAGLICYPMLACTRGPGTGHWGRNVENFLAHVFAKNVWIHIKPRRGWPHSMLYIMTDTVQISGWQCWSGSLVVCRHGTVLMCYKLQHSWLFIILHFCSLQTYINCRRCTDWLRNCRIVCCDNWSWN